MRLRRWRNRFKPTAAKTATSADLLDPDAAQDTLVTNDQAILGAGSAWAHLWDDTAEPQSDDVWDSFFEGSAHDSRSSRWLLEK